MELRPKDSQAALIEIRAKVEGVAGKLFNLFSGLMGQKAQVVFVIDRSGSMTSDYRNGTVDALTMRGLALGCYFDDNKAIDVVVFDTSADYAGELTESDFGAFVQKLKSTYAPRGKGTNYAPAIEVVRQHFFPDVKREGGGILRKGKGPYKLDAPAEYPVYVVFITDGNCWDEDQTTALMRDISGLPMFFQFVGIGKNERFAYLEKLDDLSGRKYDNAGFFEVPSVTDMDDQAYVEGLLNEFPDYVKIIKKAGLIK